MSSNENFAKHFQLFLQQQSLDLESLLSASNSTHHHHHHHQQQQQPASDYGNLRPLIDRVLSNYESYYRAKSQSSRQNVLPMFTPTWTSSTENLFLWVAGWRPSLAFHLLYSKSGVQLDRNLARNLDGVRTHDLSGLTHDQLARIDQLQRVTIAREKEISEEEAGVQETVANREMVELAEAMTGSGGDREEEIGEEMRLKEEGMVRVMEKADRLRMDTFRSVVEILSPLQSVQFLITAAELHLRVHEFGKRKDEHRANAGDDGLN